MHPQKWVGFPPHLWVRLRMQDDQRRARRRAPTFGHCLLPGRWWNGGFWGANGTDTSPPNIRIPCIYVCIYTDIIRFGLIKMKLGWHLPFWPRTSAPFCPFLRCVLQWPARSGSGAQQWTHGRQILWEEALEKPRHRQLGWTSTAQSFSHGLLSCYRTE